MAEKGKLSQRDSTLIGILERMVGQLQKQDQMLEDMENRQSELLKAVEATELYHNAQLAEASAKIEKMHESIYRYRSDMLSLVHTQDTISKEMADVSALMSKTTYSLELSNHQVSALEERVKTQEKAINDHFTHSLKQAEILPKEIADSNRSITKLHMDTEKSLGRMHSETQRQLEKLQLDIARRLRVLGDIESALRVLLIRTEPPEKKPAWFLRVFRWIGEFIRARWAKIFRRLKIWWSG